MHCQSAVEECPEEQKEGEEVSVLIKGLNIKPCKDGFGGKGLVIIGYDDKLYAVAHEQIIPLPDHGRLVDADEVIKESRCGDYWWETEEEVPKILNEIPTIIPAERSGGGV